MTAPRLNPREQIRQPWPVRRGWIRARRRPRPARSRRPLWLALGLALLLVLGWLLWRPTLRFFYPLRYAGELRRHSLEFGLPPSLVAAVVLHESQFQPEAHSNAGALGLMQLLPSTARWVADLEGHNGPLNLLEPDTNLKLGAAYLGHLRHRFRGDRVAVLAAYNAGPENVVAWMAGQTLQISRIPFPETRHYVRRVLRSQLRYQQLYPELDR